MKGLRGVAIGALAAIVRANLPGTGRMHTCIAGSYPSHEDRSMFITPAFAQAAGAGDHPDGAGGVSLRRSEFLPRGEGEDLAGLGAAPSGARARSAGRLLSAAGSRFQLRQERETRSGSRRRAPRAARSQDRLYG